MATIAERLALIITANPDDAIRGLNQLEREAGKALGQTDERLDRVGHNLTRMGAGMLSVGALGIAGLGKAAMATSDLNEAISLTEAIFGDAAGEIGDFSAEASSSIGQSERAAREATATFGGLLQNMGVAQDETVKWSKDLTVLASDLGSAFNTNPEDAVLALGSALRGESEPIRRYNVMLDDASVKLKAVELGLASSTNEVDNAAKVQARLALIMEQTSSVQGNFADTADGMANAQRTFNAQMEDFQAALGEGVLPVMEKLLSKGTDLLAWFNKLDPATQGAIAQAATYASGLLIVGGALSFTVGQVIKMRDNLKSLAGVLKGNIAAIGGLAAVLGTALLVYQEWRSEQEADKARVETLIGLYDELGEVMGRREFFRAQVEGSETLRKALIDMGLTVEDLVGIWDRTQASGESFSSVMQQMYQGDLPDFALSVRTTGYEFGNLEQAITDADKKAAELAATGAETADATDDVGEAAAGATPPIEALGEEVVNLTNVTGDLEGAWSDLVDELLGGFDAQTRAMQLVDEISASVEELDGKTTAEVRAQISEFITELAKTKGAAAEAGEDISGFSDTAELGILAIAAQAGLTVAEVDLIRQSLISLDGLEVNTTIRTRWEEVGRPPVDRIPDIVNSRATTPNRSSLEGIDWDAVGRLTNSMSSTGQMAPQSVTVTVPVNIDGREVAQVVAEANIAAGGQYVGNG